MREEWYNLSFSIENNVGIINLNNKADSNAISTKFLRELKNGLKVFHHSKDVKVIVVKGESETFSMGIRKEELSSNHETVTDFCEFGWKVFNKFSEIQKPVIAEVQGNAFDAGFELSLMADLLFASNQAQFGFPSIKNSIVPAFGGLAQLLHMTGIRYTRDLLYTGRIVTAQEGKEKGFVNGIFPPDSLHEEVSKIAQQIIQTPISILGGLKNSSGKISDIMRRLHMQDEISIFESGFLD
ncbi:MAG: enoyl-CoA hydratase/isomerase family protein [Caldisericia bacterium]|nr:enoyl-CoA hydratase/isomerase family protein [Caldisericia bacterium]MDD4613910.1 enoyl-CoA hydratase/isomerase family protein [Caldisericia bacterium]